MVTVNAPKRKCLENEVKMHFACTLAVLAMLGTFKLHLKGLGNFFSKFMKKKFTGYFINFFVFCFLFFGEVIQLHCETKSMVKTTLKVVE